MSHSLPRFLLLLTLFSGAVVSIQAQQREAVFHGRPVSAWIESIKNNDEDMDQAFQALKDLGPKASAAVPTMIEILDEPFDAIQVGVDDDDTIAEKLAEIQLRADAVDSLAAMGVAAAPATESLISWGLTRRVLPENIETVKDYKAFVDLVALDTLERVRVVNVVATFPREAAPAILVLINSPLGDERKLAVAILKEHTLPIAATLLKSEKCEDRKLGITLLMDLWATIPTENLMDLKLAAQCSPGGEER